MAKRQGIKVIDSTEVMGEDSFVKSRPILWKNAKETTRKNRALEDGDEKTLEQADLLAQLIVDSLIEWNWVDFDGEPLPLPKTVAEFDALLTTDEVNFLIREMVGSGERQKN